MNKAILNTIFIALFLIFSKAVLAEQSILIVEGVYQGKDLYIKNPDKAEAGKSVTRVIVNGKLSTDEINTSSFIIDLSLYQLVIGDTVEIKIFHDKRVKPSIINPEVLLPKSTCEITMIKIDNTETLTWGTANENHKNNFIIEQFKWGKWIKVGEVKGVGKPQLQTYKYKVSAHSGENKYRVYQKDYTGKKQVIKEIVYISDKEEVKFFPKKVNDRITFTEETSYEVIDTYGNIVKKGKSDIIDFTDLKKGLYYLNYDNNTEGITKK